MIVSMVVTDSLERRLLESSCHVGKLKLYIEHTTGHRVLSVG